MIARLHEVAGEHFRIRETDHFTIAYNTHYNALRPLVGRLEGTYDAVWRFCRANDLVAEAPTRRLEVVLFDRYEEYLRYAAGVGVAAGSMAGFYHPRTNLATFCNMHNSPVLAGLAKEILRVEADLSRSNAGTAPKPKNRARRQLLQRTVANLRAQQDALVKRFNRFVIQHEVAHQFLFNLGLHVRGGKNPVWLVEGLGCQFEVPQSDGAGKLKRVNQSRLGDFREALGIPTDAGRVSPDLYMPAATNKRWLTLVELIGLEEMFGKRNDEVAYRYAQAWALVYYLYREHRGPFIKYLQRLGTRRPGESFDRQQEIAEFESHFGKPDAAFEGAWVNFTLKLRFDRREAGR